MQRILVRSVIFLLLLSSSSLCDADHSHDVYFDEIKGSGVGERESMVGEGVLINSDGVVTPHYGELAAETGGTRCLVETTGLVGGDTQEFRRIFTFNASSEFCKCRCRPYGMEAEMTFGVSLNGSKAELRTAFGDSGGELQVSNSPEGNTSNGLVEITGENSALFPLVTIKHTRRED